MRFCLTIRSESSLLPGCRRRKTAVKGWVVSTCGLFTLRLFSGFSFLSYRTQRYVDGEVKKKNMQISACV